MACRDCQHWKSVERDTDEEAFCPMIGIYARIAQPRTREIYTSRDFACSLYKPVKLEVLVDPVVVLAEQWGC